MKWRAGVRCCALSVAWSGACHALCAGPWERVPQVGHEVVQPLPLVLVGASIVPPVLLSPTGADYELRRVSQGPFGGTYNPEPVTIWAPYVLAGATAVVFLGAAVGDACPVQRQTSAMIQGMMGTALVVGLTKFVVGRQWPAGGRDPEAADRLEFPQDGQDYRPFSRGLSAAFPSGHTAIMFAAAAAFRASAPRGSWWRFFGYPFALGVGFGMWFGDHHWASDVLSGGLLGEAMGGAAGRAWAPEVDAETKESAWSPSRLDWAVFPTRGGAALMAEGEF